MQVCALTKDHYEELSIFLEGQTQGIIPRNVWMDRFPCFWEDNPSLRDGSNQRGWLIINDQGRIGGFFGNIPMLYYCKGEEKIFAIASSWFVDPSCRNHSLAIFRCFLKEGKGKTQLCTTPSPEVTFIFKKMGFQSFEAEWLKEGYFFPANSWEFSHFLRYRLFKNRIISAISACLMPLLSFIIDFYKFLYKLRTPEKKEGQYLIREIDTFGKEYDAFWEKFRSKFDILAVRNQETLNWLLLGTPQLKSERKVLEIRREQELIGYVAVKEVARQVQSNRDVRYYEMVDAALLEDNRELFLELLDKMKSLACQNRISFIKLYSLFPYWKSIMRQKGFLRMGKESRFVYKDLSADLQGLKSWLTPLDGDRGFF